MITKVKGSESNILRYLVYFIRNESLKCLPIHEVLLSLCNLFYFFIFFD